MLPLTKKQYETLEYIKNYRAYHGFMPTQAELARDLKISLGGSTNARINQLVKRGYITKTGSARGFILTEQPHE